MNQKTLQEALDFMDTFSRAERFYYLVAVYVEKAEPQPPSGTLDRNRKCFDMLKQSKEEIEQIINALGKYKQEGIEYAAVLGGTIKSGIANLEKVVGEKL